MDGKPIIPGGRQVEVIGRESAAGAYANIEEAELDFLKSGRYTKSVVNVEIPHYADIVKSVQWGADQIPELPFIGWDFAVTDDGLHFIEANSMCSYSKYVGAISRFYEFDECDAFLKARY